MDVHNDESDNHKEISYERYIKRQAHLRKGALGRFTIVNKEKEISYQEIDDGLQDFFPTENLIKLFVRKKPTELFVKSGVA